MNRASWITIFTLLVSACAGKQAPGYTYNEVVIVNQTRAQVQDVTIAASESGRMFSCGSIAPRGICSNRFPAQPYSGKPIQIAWLIGGGQRHSKILELTLPSSFVPEVPMRGVLVIDPQGQVSAYLQQEAPGPHL